MINHNLRARFTVLMLLLLCLILSACQGQILPETVSTTEPMVSTTVADPNLLTGANAYAIVYDKDCGPRVKEACELLQKTMGDIPIVSDDEAVGEYEILVGATNRDESAKVSAGLDAFDYRIAVEGKKLVLAGGSDTALTNAIAQLVRGDGISAGNDGEWILSVDYSLYFDGAEAREEYIAAPDRFLVSWAYKFDVPEWMLDYQEKMAAFRDPGGRMMASHHRGGFLYYPENSIEAIISSVKMGADNIEVDLRITRDGVVVLLHNDTLTATTDWSDKAGENGLPESPNVSDWSYEELCQLRLLTYDGKVTDYQIPTFKEALQVCKGRTTLRLDKIGKADWEPYVYPVIQETGAWSTCIIPDWYTLEQKKDIADTIMEQSGEQIMFYYSLYPEECADWEVEVDALTQEGYLPIVRWETFRTTGMEARVEAASPYLEQIKDKVRINADVQAANQCKEKAEVWDYLHEVGVGLMLIDNGLMVQHYIADTYEPTPY